LCDLRLELRQLEIDVAVRVGDDQIRLREPLIRELLRESLEFRDEIGPP
jgi:hypothetical protein